MSNIKRPKSDPNYVSNNPTGNNGGAVHYSMNLLYTPEQWKAGDPRLASKINPKRRCVICLTRVRRHKARPICKPCMEFMRHYRDRADNMQESKTPLGRLLQARRFMVMNVGVDVFCKAVLKLESEEAVPEDSSQEAL